MAMERNDLSKVTLVMLVQNYCLCKYYAEYENKLIDLPLKIWLTGSCKSR